MANGHQPVLLGECLEFLAVRADGFYVDGTVGLGGHAAAILERNAPGGLLLGVDRDEETLELASERLRPFGARAELRHGDYRELPALLGDRRPDGILLDLGVNSEQLDQPHRGFSFRHEGPLDMRFDRSEGPTAAEIVGRAREEELQDILHRFGEERFSRRIARAIVETRLRTPIETTTGLAALVRRAAFRPGRPALDPATRTFQALRIFVNRELDGLAPALARIAGLLAPQGRMAVIAFHSLEDREVKQTFRSLSGNGFRLLTRKPVRPGDVETRENPRARSARLRAIAREEAA